MCEGVSVLIYLIPGKGIRREMIERDCLLSIEKQFKDIRSEFLTSRGRSTNTPGNCLRYQFEYLIDEKEKKEETNSPLQQKRFENLIIRNRSINLLRAYRPSFHRHSLLHQTIHRLKKLSHNSMKLKHIKPNVATI